MTKARLAIVLWCAIEGSLNILAMLLGSRGRNNLWLGYIGHPLLSAALLWALAQWHPAKSARLALKIAIPLVLLVSVVLTLTLDDPGHFSLAVVPFHAIVMLLATVWTFVSLSLVAERSLANEDWFWIIGGVMLYAATAAAMQPLAWYLIRERVDLLHAAFNVRAAVVILSFAAITWGMLLRGAPRYSGGSSWPPSSPSSSSSAGSA
ncbi:MAG: hypothetical protein ACSLFE_04420 [Gemmatimonadaceae bacterium]